MTALYDCCGSLSEEERKHDAGAFFKSIHGTLNHLLLGDRIWLGRFTGKPFEAKSLDQELTPALLNGDPNARRRTLRFQIGSLAFRRRSRWPALLYEPGESRAATASALAGGYAFLQSPNASPRATDDASAQRGIDPGVTDLIWLPGCRRMVSGFPGRLNCGSNRSLGALRALTGEMVDSTKSEAGTPIYERFVSNDGQVVHGSRAPHRLDGRRGAPESIRKFVRRKTREPGRSKAICRDSNAKPRIEGNSGSVRGDLLCPFWRVFAALAVRARRMIPLAWQESMTSEDNSGPPQGNPSVAGPVI